MRFPPRKMKRTSVNYSLFTIHSSLLVGRLAGAVIAGLLLLQAVIPATAQEPAPLVVDADQVTFDDATQTMEAAPGSN